MDDKILKVVIADDEALALNGIANIVDNMDGFTVVGKAFNGEQALMLVQDNKADILLTDIKMPNTDGMWLIDRIEKLNINITIIVISAYDDQKYLRSAIRNPNVFDYIFKPFMKDEIVELLQVAANHHNRKNSNIDNNLNVNLIINAITSNNNESITNDVELFFQNYAADLQSAKEKAYGLVMHINKNVFIEQSFSNKMFENDIMSEIYDCDSLSSLKVVITNYLNECSNRYVKNEEVTTVVQAALQIVQQEIDNCDLNLNYIANKLDVTPNYLSGKFSRDMKQSFSNYLTHIRINVAKDLLNDISKKVYEVSLDVGYADVSYFNKVFKEHTGLTPLQYRQEMISINKNDEREINSNEGELKTALLASKKKYPNLQPEDAVKLIYQNEFGWGTAIEDSKLSLKELQDEYESIPHGFGFPYEDIGNGLIRLSLNHLDLKACSLEHLNQLCVQTSKLVHGNLDSFIEKLKVLKSMTDEGLMPFNSIKLNSFLNEYSKAGYPSLGHSDIMIEYYHPAYRLVLKKLCDFIIE